jgi:outer membrane receptor for ferrienterochelin and colicins
MVLIDGMPIVSSLSTVYGLSGIPQSLIKRIEVIKGPASTLYGSEAVAGLINIITRDAGSTPKARLEWSATSIGETNLDFSTRWKQGKNQSYLGLNAFWYGLPKDRNADGFTDLALQQRVSVFNKWDFHTKSGKKASLAVRLFNENRWGGQNNWTPEWRGTDSIYGETIQTQRVEVLGTLPVMALQNIKLDYSYNFHQQNSAYGIQDFFASQHTGFAQLVWNLEKGKWKGVSGLPIRLQHYDDNTPATGSGEINASGIQQKTIVLPGLFSQWEYQWSPRFTALAGLRYDAHPVHGGIWTPRIGFRKALNSSHTLRFSAGSGFRVVQLFAEDHAALTGARTVVLEEALRPEKSWNGNLGYQWDMNHHKGFGVLEVNAFLTRFSNQIQGDFETDPEKIIYSNLSGYGISQGVSVQYQREWGNGFRLLAGATWMDVFRMHKKSGGQYSRQTQLFAPPLSGTFTLSYKIQSLMLDFSGRINGPMKLPVFPNDFRPAWSPVYPLLNFQVSSTFRSGLEWQLGLRNLLNFQPSNPILRPFDPFDKRVNENNPQGYSFDPSYNYAPLQGTTIYGGLRWTMN